MGVSVTARDSVRLMVVMICKRLGVLGGLPGLKIETRGTRLHHFDSGSLIREQAPDGPGDFDPVSTELSRRVRRGVGGGTAVLNHASGGVVNGVGARSAEMGAAPGDQYPMPGAVGPFDPDDDQMSPPDGAQRCLDIGDASMPEGGLEMFMGDHGGEMIAIGAIADGVRNCPHLHADGGLSAGDILRGLRVFFRGAGALDTARESL